MHFNGSNCNKNGKKLVVSLTISVILGKNRRNLHTVKNSLISSFTENFVQKCLFVKKLLYSNQNREICRETYKALCIHHYVAHIKTHYQVIGEFTHVIIGRRRDAALTTRTCINMVKLNNLALQTYFEV